MTTTYELCRAIRASILTQAAMVFSYNWKGDYALEEARNIPEKIKSKKGFKTINPNDLTETELKELGFKKWSEDTDMRLIPLWLFSFLTDEFMACSIDNYEPRMMKLSEMDNDARFGCIAFGVIPKKEE